MGSACSNQAQCQAATPKEPRGPRRHNFASVVDKEQVEAAPAATTSQRRRRVSIELPVQPSPQAASNNVPASPASSEPKILVTTPTLEQIEAASELLNVVEAQQALPMSKVAGTMFDSMSSRDPRSRSVTISTVINSPGVSERLSPRVRPAGEVTKAFQDDDDELPLSKSDGVVWEPLGANQSILVGAGSGSSDLTLSDHANVPSPIGSSISGAET